MNLKKLLLIPLTVALFGVAGMAFAAQTVTTPVVCNMSGTGTCTVQTKIHNGTAINVTVEGVDYNKTYQCAFGSGNNDLSHYSLVNPSSNPAGVSFSMTNWNSLSPTDYLTMIAPKGPIGSYLVYYRLNNNDPISWKSDIVTVHCQIP